MFVKTQREVERRERKSGCGLEVCNIRTPDSFWINGNKGLNGMLRQRLSSRWCSGAGFPWPRILPL